MSLTIAQLAGLYRLETAPIEALDGSPGSFPYGKDALGWLLYRSDGFISFHMMASGRPPFPQMDLFGGTPAENNAAFRTCIAFCGRYVIEGDTIWYDIDIASIPNFVGVRAHHTRAEVTGDKLFLISRPFEIGGKLSQTHFIWKRVATA